jgi:hypothetical protein
MEPTAFEVLEPGIWLEATRRHQASVEPLARAWIERRSRDAKHPVHDFLFTYYSFSPTKLCQWLPPLGTALLLPDRSAALPAPWPTHFMRRDSSRVWLDASRMALQVPKLAAWVAQLCAAIASRPAHFRCFGLHEWAMVYRQSAEERRHRMVPLRLPDEEVNTLVQSLPLCCTHYDAFRFFTPQARPLNSLAPTLEQRVQLEQGGCLHANMDLYKWCSKLWPWVGSDLLRECFEIALAGRELDMRASPYDLAHLGYSPIPIETAEGRAEYEREQRLLASRAAKVRGRLERSARSLADGCQPQAQ